MSHNYGTDIYSFLSVPRTYHEIQSHDFGIDSRNVFLVVARMEREGLITVSKHWHYQNDVFNKFRFYYQSEIIPPPIVVSVPYADLLADWVTTNQIMADTLTIKRSKVNKRIKVMIELGLLEVQNRIDLKAIGFAKNKRYYRLKVGWQNPILPRLKTNSNRVGSEGWRRLARWNIQRGDR